MECCTGPLGILRKFVLITLVGFGVVVLAPPAIGVIGALLPFAIVGGLVWLLVQTVLLGPRVVWGTLRGLVRLVLAGPIWVVRNTWGGLRWGTSSLIAATGTVLSLLIPMAGGVIAGGLLGMVGGMEHNDADMRIPAGMLIGGAVGTVAAIMHARPKRQPAQIA